MHPVRILEGFDAGPCRTAVMVGDTGYYVTDRVTDYLVEREEAGRIVSTYRVWAGPGCATCACPARRTPCVHKAAVAVVRARW